VTDPEQRPTPPDPLDELLGRAEWPEPEPSAHDRMVSHWRMLRAFGMRRSPWRRRAVRAAMLVAAVVLIACGGWLVFRPGGQQLIAPIEDERPTERLVEHTPTVEPIEAEDANPQPTQTPNARPANAYERLLVRSIERRRTLPPRVAPTTANERLQQYLAGHLELGQLTEDTGRSSPDLERLAITQISQSSPEEQHKLIALLREIGGPASVPAFVELSDAEATHDAAFDAILELADADTLLQLAYRHQDAEMRSRLCQELLARNEERAIAAFLQLVMDPAQRQIALEGLDTEATLPIDLLFRFMRSSDPSRRLAAAIVLGRIDRPEVTERLIAVARSQFNRQEALVALLVDRDRRAQEFLALAQRDQGFFAAVNSAHVQLQLISHRFPGEGS